MFTAWKDTNLSMHWLMLDLLQFLFFSKIKLANVLNGTAFA